MNDIDSVVKAVAPVVKLIEVEIREHLDDLTKPRGSLGSW